ncbi:MAG: NAD(P)/FAD-dependent oxidoreductase [Bacteroidota bacterium]
MTDKLIRYDVLIAGAGPAGCASAIVLANAGLKVALLDEVSEGFKVGESLPSAAIRLLRRLGINHLNDLLDNKQFSRCTANASAWGNNNWTFTDALQNPEGGGWHLVRESFDKSLRQKALMAGAVLYNGKAGKIKTNPLEKFRYRTYFKSKKSSLPEYLESNWLIDATGRPSVVLKQLGIERTHYHDQLAAVCWLKPKTDEKDHTTRIKSVNNGWLYSALLPDQHRVLAFYGLSTDVADMIRNPENFFETVNATDILEYPINIENLAVGLQATKAGLSKAMEVVGDHWLAVGDAALALDPLSSQGMFFSLYSGIRGAETILQLIKSDHSSENIASQYQKKVDEVFNANQKSRKYYYTSELRYTDNPFWNRWF